jgi:hypothetical protein
MKWRREVIKCFHGAFRSEKKAGHKEALAAILDINIQSP